MQAQFSPLLVTMEGSSCQENNRIEQSSSLSDYGAQIERISITIAAQSIGLFISDANTTNQLLPLILCCSTSRLHSHSSHTCHTLASQPRIDHRNSSLQYILGDPQACQLISYCASCSPAFRAALVRGILMGASRHVQTRHSGIHEDQKNSSQREGDPELPPLLDL
jgi:hypothetical protein